MPSPTPATLAVDTEHPLYKKNRLAWKMVRDCVSGPVAVKAEGDLYLPRFFKQTTTAYEAFKKRAKFFGATKRTLQAFMGFIFNKNPDWKVPANTQMKALQKDATLTGKSLYDWAKDTTACVASLGRRGTLVDWAPEPEDRVVIKTYEAEDIVNWSSRRVAGRTVLSLLVLKECTSETGAGFEHDEVEQWRVYRLVEGNGEPFVKVDVYRRKTAEKRGQGGTGPAAGGEFAVVDQQYPERRGVGLHRIPFVFHGAAGGDADPGEIPMYDIADVNLSHYRGSADLANARHAAGVPTPYIFGISKDEAKKEIHLGTSEALVSTNAQATCGFLSYGGEGLASLEKGIEEDERQMAALGASMLDRQGGASGKNQEAFETVQLRMAGTTSALVAIVIACSQTLSDVVQWCVWYQKSTPAADPEDLDETVGVELGTEFLNLVLDSGMLGQLMQAYQSKGMSFKTLFWNLQKGGLQPSEKKIEEELKDIEDDPLGLPGAEDMTGALPPKTKKEKGAGKKKKQKVPAE